MKDKVGIFFVAKKGKTKVRLVIDARRSNCRFASPPSVDLLTGEGPSGIEVELPVDVEPDSAEAAEILEDVKVSLGVSDVSDAFYRMRIPYSLSRYFCLPEIRAGDVGMDGCYLDGQLLEKYSLLCPAAGSLPMGFSWSLFFCQDAVSKAVATSDEMKVTALLTDRGGNLVLDATATGPRGVSLGNGCRKGVNVYVDNLGVFGFVTHEVAAEVDGMSRQLDSIGRHTHEQEVTVAAT